MGIEKSFDTIEGATEECPPFVETEPKDAISAQLPHIISWSEWSARVVFDQVSIDQKVLSRLPGDIQNGGLYTANLHFPKPSREMASISLTNILEITKTGNRKCLFVGCQNGFYELDLAGSMPGCNLIVIGVDPVELENDIRRMAAIYHELGHASLDARGIPLTTCPPEIGVSRYIKALKDASNNELCWRILRIFHERNAWAYGYWLLRKYRLPLGDAGYDFFLSHAKECLSSYSEAYQDKRFDQGLKKDRAKARQ